MRVWRFRLGITFFIFSVLLGLRSFSSAQVSTPSDPNSPSCSLHMKIEGAVTSGTADYLDRGFKKATALGCVSIVLSINTPGGSLSATRTIVENILASPLPVLCLVSPSGGHAGSAGAIILMACHVNGAEPATNIGAATPIAGTGQALPEDVRRKTLEDTVSWVTGLARLRGRSLDFASKIVSEAKAVDAEEAVRLGAVDTLATDMGRFLSFADAREVTLSGDRRDKVRVGALTPFEPDLRHRFLQLVTDPELAYFIFMASLALLYFELTHAGAIVPGVAGALGLITSLVAFNQLNVWWGGVALIAIGLAFLLAEAFVPSFGALGIGGIVALGAGSLMLYDPPGPGGVQLLPYSTIVLTTSLVGSMMMALAILAFRTRKLGRAKAETALLNRVGDVLSLESPSLRKGMILVRGEYWKFRSEKDLRVGDKVEVTAQEGLTLFVRPYIDPNPQKGG